MFVKPGPRPDEPGKTLVVRMSPHMRPLRTEGEDVPDTIFWHRRLRDGDVVLAERPKVAPALATGEPLPEKIGELIADGAVQTAEFKGDHPAEPAIETGIKS